MFKANCSDFYSKLSQVSLKIIKINFGRTVFLP